MTTATALPTIVRFHDREGGGTCQACQREGLRWTATLSDRTEVGLECAKKATGAKRPAPAVYAWVADYEVIAEHDDYGVAYALWKHRSANRTCITRNGVLESIGGGCETWARRGFPA